MRTIFLVFFIAFFSFSCGTDSTSATSSSATSCQTGEANKHQGCCSSHGGASTCEGGFIYNGSGALMCTDGTASPSCVR